MVVFLGLESGLGEVGIGFFLGVDDIGSGGFETSGLPRSSTSVRGVIPSLVSGSDDSVRVSPEFVLMSLGTNFVVVESARIGSVLSSLKRGGPNISIETDFHPFLLQASFCFSLNQ